MRSMFVEAGMPKGTPAEIMTLSSGSAAALMTTAPLLIAFLLFQRQFVQSFMRVGIR